MRKKFALLLASLILLVPALVAGAQDLPDLGGATISIAVESSYIPFSFIDLETDEPIGLDYDLLDELCARLNCVPEFIETAWDGMILAVSNGEFDMAVGGITIKPDRAEIVDFTDGYVSLVQVLLSRLDEARFSDGESLAADESLLVGVQPATTNYWVALGLVGEERIVAYETFPVAVQALIAGDVDAVVMDDVAGQGYVGVNADRLQIIGGPLTSLEEIGYIFPLGSELRDAMNAGLDSMREDGTLEAISNKWFLGAEPETALPDLMGASISIAVESSYIPFSFIDLETDEPIGLDYDLLAELCARLNCVPEFIETAWDGMILAVSNGEFDMAVGGITIKPDRAEIVDFTDGYVTLVQVLLSRIDEARFSDGESLAADESLLVGVQPATTNYWVALDLVGEERIVAYETFPVAVQALIAGDVDAVVMDDVAGQGYVGVNADRLQIIGGPLTSLEEIGYIFPLGSELRDAMNAGLDSMREDGTLEAISNKWFLGA